MSETSARFIVGIDLGTTHTVVAYAEPARDPETLQLFAIPQLIAPGDVAARPLLPSVRYHPAAGELHDAALSFHAPDEWGVIGEAARTLGAKSQGRLVTSAKSWLSHSAIDPLADILPWGADDSVRKISPLNASASYLAHVRWAWNQHFPDAPLEHQDLVITVPASFDAAARALTVEAARLAGLPRLRLLEEPQAVFYDWLRRHRGQLATVLQDVRLLLIVDVGGGTTDLTLIKIEPGAPEPKLTRIGVGDHLMLGGDNIDWALAHLAENRLLSGHDDAAPAAEQKKLSAAALSQLLEQCRIAKERLLGPDAPASVPVTLLGAGSRLIGGARTTWLTRDEVQHIALDGFFPLSALDEFPSSKRSGVVAFGLPYAAEPAISKHIAAFLNAHRHAAQQATHGAMVPDALLLNGGVFRSASLRQRAVAVLTQWRERPPLLLRNDHPEFAVAYGAVSYVLAKRLKQWQIGGGAARSYFLVVETDAAQQRHGVCILPRGCEEGDEQILRDRQFALRLGEPVQFHVVSTSGDTPYQLGELVTLTEEFHSLPPLAVAFQHDDASVQQVTVQLATSLTETGTLQLQCLAVENPERRWDVEFPIRRAAPSVGIETTQLPPRFDEAKTAIERVFGPRSKEVAPQAIKSLRGDLEKLLGPRDGWPTPWLRALFATLWEYGKHRRRSDTHERVWLGLIGYCLRPGFGYPLDDWRIEQLWKIYPQGIQYVSETQNWSEWWTLWRRVAGGLSEHAQQTLFDAVALYLNPATARQGHHAQIAKKRGYEDMVRLAAALERLPVASKIQLGTWLLQRLQKPGESLQCWWALGRVASRVPFHGSAHSVVPRDVASAWLRDHLLALDWKKLPQAGFAATMIARKSGDRVRDLDEDLCQSVIAKLHLAKAPQSWIALIETVTTLDAQQENQIFGEALPPGLRLL